MVARHHRKKHHGSHSYRHGEHPAVQAGFSHGNEAMEEFIGRHSNVNMGETELDAIYGFAHEHHITLTLQRVGSESPSYHGPETAQFYANGVKLFGTADIKDETLAYAHQLEAGKMAAPLVKAVEEKAAPVPLPEKIEVVTPPPPLVQAEGPKDVPPSPALPVKTGTTVIAPPPSPPLVKEAENSALPVPPAPVKKTEATPPPPVAVVAPAASTITFVGEVSPANEWPSLVPMLEMPAIPSMVDMPLPPPVQEFPIVANPALRENETATSVAVNAMAKLEFAPTAHGEKFATSTPLVPTNDKFVKR